MTTTTAASANICAGSGKPGSNYPYSLSTDTCRGCGKRLRTETFGDHVIAAHSAAK